MFFETSRVFDGLSGDERKTEMTSLTTAWHYLTLKQTQDRCFKRFNCSYKVRSFRQTTDETCVKSLRTGALILKHFLQDCFLKRTAYMFCLFVRQICLINKSVKYSVFDLYLTLYLRLLKVQNVRTGHLKQALRCIFDHQLYHHMFIIHTQYLYFLFQYHSYCQFWYIAKNLLQKTNCCWL